MNRLSVIEMAYERSLLVSGRFRGSQFNWVVVDKKVFAVLRPFQRLDYLLHSNIVYIFNS